MDYINPIFNKNDSSKIEKHSKPSKITILTKSRATRSDKQHNCKFPVDSILQMKLRSYFRQAARIFEKNGQSTLSQTKFNTLLLRFGLKNPDILTWDKDYKDTKVYMHTQLLETEFEEIGGPHGLAVRKSMSERKIVFHVIHSVIRWLEGSGDIEKIL